MLGVYGYYQTPDGVIRLQRGSLPVFESEIGEMEVPSDVWLRALRLQLRGAYERHEYAAKWCRRVMEKAANG